MFTKKSHQDVKKSTVKIQDSKKDSTTRLKHLKIVLDHFEADEAKTYFEANFSHVYFILYDNFILAENNLRQRELPFHLVHKAGKEELEGALSLLEKVLCLLPELIGKRWQLHSLTRIFSKLLHGGNSQKLRADAIRFFLLWYQALGENAPQEVHRMFASLVPGLPDSCLPPTGSPFKPKVFDLVTNMSQNSSEFKVEDILQHPNFSSTESAKKVVVEHTSTGFMGKLANVSASIFHDTNALNPVQSVDIQPLLPPSTSEKVIENETKHFFEILLDAMATSVTKVQWKDRSHAKAMRSFAFLLEKFKMYYLPVICPQYNYKNSLYKPNLDLPVQHNILEDDFAICRVVLIKWVANYVHFMKKQGSDGGQPSSMTSTGSHIVHSNTPTPATSLHHEEETSFTVGHPSDSSRASSHDSASNTPHPSLESGTGIYEELSSDQVVRDVLCCSSREHVDFTIEILRQAFLLPFTHAAAVRRVIALYKDWIQMNVAEIPPFLLENVYDQQAGGEPQVPPRRLRNDSYLGAVGRDNIMVRAGLQNILQIFMTQAANVFVSSSSVAPPGGPPSHQLLEEQTDTCKRVLNIYRYMVMHVAMDDRSWEQLLLVLLQITSIVLTKVPPKKKQESLGGHLAPALFQTLIVTWIKANLNVAVKPELWQSFMELLTRLTHWEDLIKEWAKTMETLTRVLARHVYSLELSESGSSGSGDARGRGRRPPPVACTHRPPPLRRAALQPADTRTPGKSPRVGNEAHPRKDASSRRPLVRCRSDPHLNRHAYSPQSSQDETKETIDNKTRRWYSLDSLRQSSHHEERDSASGSRSPSPAPSSGVESSSIKDSPLQIDLASDGGNVEWSEADNGESVEGDVRGVGVVLGGRARGWLPDVAWVMWRRMLAALGDPNALRDAHAHQHLFNYLIHLNATLVKISANQTLNGNTEIHVPFNLVAGWCLEAEALPPSHRSGKLLALRLLCESTQAQGPGAPTSCNNRLHLAHLNLYQRALHHGLTGEDRSVVDVLVEFAAPRYLSLALDGYSLLLLDFVHASTVVLNSSDMGPSCPRTAAVTFLGSLLSLPDGLMNAPMLQPYPHQYNTVSCPDLKEHVLNIVVRVCRREGAAAARCAGACALAAHVCHLLATRTHCERLPAYVTCLLQMLMMKNKTIAKVVSDAILVLADYTDRIVEMYPGLAEKILKWICACLAHISHNSGRDAVKPLAGSLLLCLAEFAVRCGPALLMQQKEDEQTLLLMIFRVLYAVMKGTNGGDIEGLTLPVDEDFDPNIQLDNLGPKTTPASSIDVKLWAQTICSQLVLYLGHWPLWTGCQLSSSVCEQHDSIPPLGSELGPAVLTAPHIQLMRLSDSTLASFIELPALDLPQGGTTPGLITSDRQVRVLLRDITGKACWDASALYYDPSVTSSEVIEPLPIPKVADTPRENTLSSLPPPLPPNLLPDYKNSPPDKHQLDHVLAYIGHTSPEVTCGRRLDEAGPTPLPAGVEDELVCALVAHRNAERHYLQHRDCEDEVDSLDLASNISGSSDKSAFAASSQLVSQLGTLAPSRRANAHLLRRTDRLLRELRNLDAQRCRETHKVAVIYVGKGQETRNEILSNRCGSAAYEAFLAALAWEVELESHVGFAGGLRGGGGGGTSAPYLATLTLEALFHVATRMPADTPDAILNKTRHLGNDEVHVVWSEHWRPYKRDTLPTQFCDVLIVLYPLPGGLLRCTVSRKPDVGVFGPLWEECIVRVSCCAALVRGAAFAGGRAVRATMPLYQHACSERARDLDALVTNHTQPTPFEHFVTRIRAPLNTQTQQTDQSSGRLANALLDHGASTWTCNTEPHSVSPRPVKRLGPFKRPLQPISAPHTAPPTANVTAPAPAPRRNR